MLRGKFLHHKRSWVETLIGYLFSVSSIGKQFLTAVDACVKYLSHDRIEVFQQSEQVCSAPVQVSSAAVLELLISCCKGLTTLWVIDRRAFKPQREFVLPPVSTLRHLILDVQQMESSALASIKEMKVLRTLLLGPNFRYKDWSPPVCEVLDLSRLPRLKHVSIRLC